jgi:hypothetical protein
MGRKNDDSISIGVWERHIRVQSCDRHYEAQQNRREIVCELMKKLLNSMLNSNFKDTDQIVSKTNVLRSKAWYRLLNLPSLDSPLTDVGKQIQRTAFRTKTRTQSRHTDADGRSN